MRVARTQGQCRAVGVKWGAVGVLSKHWYGVLCNVVNVRAIASKVDETAAVVCVSSRGDVTKLNNCQFSNCVVQKNKRTAQGGMATALVKHSDCALARPAKAATMAIFLEYCILASNWRPVILEKDEDGGERNFEKAAGSFAS